MSSIATPTPASRWNRWRSYALLPENVAAAVERRSKRGRHPREFVDDDSPAAVEMAMVPDFAYTPLKPAPVSHHRLAAMFHAVAEVPQRLGLRGIHVEAVVAVQAELVERNAMPPGPAKNQELQRATVMKIHGLHLVYLQG